ncbi:MAG: amidohydrolase family protein [Egibacteraceae bacterium]
MTGTVLEHVTVIDGTGAPPRVDMSVVLRGERIAGLHKTGTAPADLHATVIDASGKFLIPGLWDMHTHTMGASDMLPLYIANGVTGIREMWGLPHHHDWRGQIASGSVVGPRMVIASRIVDGPGSIFAQFSDEYIEAADEADGRDSVRRAVDDDADFVKVYSLLPRSAYFAIAEEARDRGIPFAGHVPDLVSLTEASDAGQHTCEHLMGVLTATSRREQEIREEQRSIAAGRTGGEDPWRAIQRSLALDRKAADAYDDSRAAMVFDVLARNGTWQVPTLSVLRIGALDERAHHDERLRYLPAGTLQRWQQSLAWFEPAPGQKAQAREFFERRVELVGAMKRAGVGDPGGDRLRQPVLFPGLQPARRA